MHPGAGPTFLRRAGETIRWAWLLPTIVLMGGGLLLADDDDGPVPPFDPGVGFEGLFPVPPLPPYLVPDQQTSPYGVRQVFNTPETIMGQSFTPTQTGVDWVAFVFQNNTQPNTTPGPGVLRASLYAELDARSGALTGLLAESDEVSIPSNTTAWLVFTFPQTVPVTAGRVYYCRLERVSGYPSWAGGRLQNFYPRGGAFGYLPNPFGGPVQNLNWQHYDLVFAQGTGRGVTGIPVGQFISWGLPLGLQDYEEWSDLDEDGVPTWLEFLRDTDPIASGSVRRSRVQLVDIAGEEYLSWTVATPVWLDYQPESDGTVRGRTRSATDTFTPLAGIQGVGQGGLRLTEVTPPIAEGLPALSSSHRYRTFRLSEPTAVAPHGFIVNRLVLAESDE